MPRAGGADASIATNRCSHRLIEQAVVGHGDVGPLGGSFSPSMAIAIRRASISELASNHLGSTQRVP